MAKKNENRDDLAPQVQPQDPQQVTQPGDTYDNPNADRDNGTQSVVQPGQGNDAASGGTPSTGGNPAAADGGQSSTSGGN